MLSSNDAAYSTLERGGSEPWDVATSSVPSRRGPTWFVLIQIPLLPNVTPWDSKGNWP